MELIGARLAEVAPGRIAIDLPFSPRISQQHGFFHGGVIGAIADSAGGYAAMSVLPPGSGVVSIEYKINFLKPARGDLIRATGEVVRAGRSICVSRTDVLCFNQGSSELVAVFQASFSRFNE